MISVVGVFKSRADATRGAAALAPLGIAKVQIKLLMPGASQGEIDSVAVVDAEQSGMGAGVGAVVGGAVGLAAGETLASLLIPGVGLVLAVGIAAAALAAWAGGTAGAALENAETVGLPAEELYVYEDALRKGRSLVIVLTEDEKQAQAARGVLEEDGAESIDRARDMWWIGLRDVEKEKYESEVHEASFEEDERYFRCGFESAQHGNHRGKSYDACRADLATLHPSMHQHAAFRRGFTRGQAYNEEVLKHRHK